MDQTGSKHQTILWRCSRCGEEHELQFSECWSCNSSQEDGEVVDSPASGDVDRPGEARTGVRFRIRTLMLFTAAVAICLLGWRLHSRLKAEDPMHAAAARGDTGTLHVMLLSGYDPDVRCESWNYMTDAPLHVAASERNLSAARVLLQYGASVNVVGHGDLTPLFHATDCTMVEFLLEHDADPLHRDSNGYTACHYLARYASESEIFNAFVDHGVDINLQSEIGTTLLHEAMIYGELQVVEKLLDLGADVHAKNKWGETPLHYAAYTPTHFGIHVGVAPSFWFEPFCGASGDKRKSIQLLLDRGASLDAVDKRGLTPADFAKYLVGRAGGDRVGVETEHAEYFQALHERTHKKR